MGINDMRLPYLAYTRLPCFLCETQFLNEKLTLGKTVLSIVVTGEDSAPDVSALVSSVAGFDVTCAKVSNGAPEHACEAGAGGVSGSGSAGVSLRAVWAHALKWIHRDCSLPHLL